MPRNCQTGAIGLQIKASTKNALRQEQIIQTKLMLHKLDNLDHIPVRMRYAYESYRTALSNGHAYAYRFHFDGKSYD